MKMTLNGLTVIILWCFASALGGCGDDPKIEVSEPIDSLDDGNASSSGNEKSISSVKLTPNLLDRVDNPDANSPEPVLPEVIVTKTDLKVMELPVELSSEVKENGYPEFPQLYSEINGTPYTGPLTRVFPNGKPEFSANYENGLLEGEARWWNNDGSLASAAQVKNGRIVKWDTVAKVQDNPADPTGASQPAFAGTFDNINELTTGFNASEEALLKDSKTGEKVSGAVQVHDENRRLKSYTEYNDGIKHGFNVWWNAKGIKVYEANFVNGKVHGIETTWDDRGAISTQDHYDNGKLLTPSEQ